MLYAFASVIEIIVLAGLLVVVRLVSRGRPFDGGSLALVACLVGEAGVELPSELLEFLQVHSSH